MGNDVGSVLKGADKEASCTEGVVYNDWDTGIMGNFANSFKVRDVVFWVSDRFNVDCLCSVINGGGDVLWLVAIDEFGIDPKSGEEDFELIVGTSVEIRGGDDIITSVGEGGNGHELRRLSRGSGNGSNTSLKGGNSLLENVDSGLETRVSE